MLKATTLATHLSVPMNDLIYRLEFEAQKLVTAYPAQLHDHNKSVLFEMASPDGATHAGTISVTRWKQMPLPETIERHPASPSFVLRDDYFLYEPSRGERIDWYLNFAHFDLFCAYGSPLFAQDEMQVAEHPALASLRHALLDSEYTPSTVENGIATPILIMDVERRCAVATDPNSDLGRPHGLYGNNFSQASEEAIRRATQVLEPPTRSNILAMEAPAGGVGRYSRKEIEQILCTAFTGFRAAVYESRRDASPNVQTVVHTGYWGCGAYGGNRELTPLLQMIAASCAGVDEFVFHTGGDADGYAQSARTLEEVFPVGRTANTRELVTLIHEKGYEWGVSDGN